MRNSASIWVVSALVSLGAHAGVMSALANISLADMKVEPPQAEIVLAGGSIAAVMAATLPAETATEMSATSGGQELPAESASEAVEALSENAPAAAESAQDQASDSRATDAQSGRDAAVAATAAASPANAVESADAVASQEGAQAQAAKPGIAAPSVPESAAAASDATLAIAAAEPAAPQPDAAASSTLIPSGGQAAGSGEAVTAVEAGAQTPAAGLEGEALSPSESSGAVLPSSGDLPVEPPALLPEGTKTASIITAVPEVISQAEKIDQFLSSYKGNGCLYARPKALDAARPSFSGFGGEQGVSDFASAFKQAIGIEPELAIHTVRDAQCPAVDFIREMAATNPEEIDIVLDTVVIANGGMLTGHLGEDPGGEVRLLVIGDDGAMNDISSNFYRTSGKNFFAAPLLADSEGRARNQIIVALVSAYTLSITVEHRPGEARRLFQDIALQAKAARVAIGFNAFRVE